MEATEKIEMQPSAEFILLENFFEVYPPEKTEQLLWRWLICGIRNDFSKISEEDFKEFSDFFQQLHLVEQSLQQQYEQQRTEKGKQPCL